MKLLWIYILIILVIQIIITYGFTYTKMFSIRAFIRNISFVIPLVYGIKYIWIPITLEVVLEVLKYNGVYIEKYVSTIYLYNDLLRDMTKEYPLLSNYSEGNYDDILGIDMTDYSQENLKMVREWARKTYDKAYQNPSPYFTDVKGEKHDAQIKYESDYKKFEYICKKCNIKPGMKILEIGFGECDFLKHIRKHYGISPVGVSIAKEQVEYARSLGFEAHCLDSWKITKEIGTFDLVLHCGNLEYIRCFGEPQETYRNYCQIIERVMNPGGKYFVTSCHRNVDYVFSFSDRVKAYLLWAGNDGGYPEGKDGYTKFAKQVGLKVTYQEDRTLDYYINEILYFSFLRCTGKCHTIVDIPSLTHALFITIAAPYFIHSYLCIQPSKYLPMPAFGWEFEPQPQPNQKLDFPVTLQYILFEKD